ALDALTLEEHGVDGSSIYVYGEGWNFGEVDNARGVNATQFNMAGTGIGTFNDRLRDAARGGTPFGGRTEQGFVNGLYTDPNEYDQGTPEDQLASLLELTDHIRLGLAGNLKDYEFVNAEGELVAGRQVLYNGQFAGYTDDPQENIVYISKHDNETLFDIIQYKAPLSTSTANRALMQNLANSIVMFSQGVPFFQAGDDMLRSKSLDRNSYNSGDWFNRLDFTYQSNNWGVGLPPAADNQEMYDVMQPILAADGITPTSEDIMFTVRHFHELLRLRQSSALFRLQTAAEVQDRLEFHNTGPDQVPGLIVMSLDDTIGVDLDPNYDAIVVLFNGSPVDQTFVIDYFVGSELMLHPIMLLSSDSYMLGANYDVASGAFTVPTRSTAVFVLPQSETTPEAVPEQISEAPEDEAAEDVHEEDAHGDDAEHVEAEPLFPAGDDGGERPLTIWLGAAGIGLLLSLLIAWMFNRKKPEDEHHAH
ncbi:MAG: DUF3372 domain-containing protein, partial [Chloroflexi bacterium]|nr:DUF3372 domain-containing protein [Chloroflexota bacterium]